MATTTNLSSPVSSSKVPREFADLMQQGLVEAIESPGGCTMKLGNVGPQTITPAVIRHLNIHGVRLLAEHAEARFGTAPHRIAQEAALREKKALRTGSKQSEPIRGESNSVPIAQPDLSAAAASAPALATPSSVTATVDVGAEPSSSVAPSSAPAPGSAPIQVDATSPPPAPQAIEPQATTSQQGEQKGQEATQNSETAVVKDVVEGEGAPTPLEGSNTAPSHGVEQPVPTPPAEGSAAQQTETEQALPSSGEQQQPMSPTSASRQFSSEAELDAARVIQGGIRGHLTRRQTSVLYGGRQLALPLGAAGCSAQSTVEVAGSYDGWQGRIPLSYKASKEKFEGVVPGRITLEQGKKYHYKFIVDGDWRLADGLTTELDEGGHANHVLMVTKPE